MTDHEGGIRQVEAIGRLVRAYKAGDASLAQMVQGIDLTIGSIGQEADPEWVNELRNAWGPMEIVFASLLDEGRVEMTDDEAVAVSESVDDLLAMTTPY